MARAQEQNHPLLRLHASVNTARLLWLLAALANDQQGHFYDLTHLALLPLLLGRVLRWHVYVTKSAVCSLSATRRLDVKEAGLALSTIREAAPGRAAAPGGVILRLLTLTRQRLSTTIRVLPEVAGAGTPNSQERNKLGKPPSLTTHEITELATRGTSECRDLESIAQAIS
ncbi:unnamed protein product [Symbiodinium natans]|uniref:Uncharacterized protein n=1 Tax=Symbiodinium natans TaxID=878477 RepID=A0A812SUT5_9DINO|nr:unnamed protein product [Symbiodinium natans]